MTLIYLASPYSVGDQILNVRRSLEIADRLLNMGYTPYCPLLNHFWHFFSPKSIETWHEIDKVILKKCDAVLRLDGISKGADAEVLLAETLGIPVYYSLGELR